MNEMFQLKEQFGKMSKSIVKKVLTLKAAASAPTYKDHIVGVLTTYINIERTIVKI